VSQALARGIVFAALLLMAPWPWYLFAVGGLLPIPVILMMALGVREPLFIAVLLVCAALGMVAFWFLARLVGRYSRSARPWAVLGAVLLLTFVWQLPIYGGGENIASPAGKFSDAYTAYAKELRELRAR
jgi:hypothetical protein